MLRWLQDRRARRSAEREVRVLEERGIPDALWLDTLRCYPFLQWRTLEQMLTLRRLSTLFLARKEFTTTHGLPLTDEIAVAIAVQACVPIVELGLAWYDAFVGIVVSPDEVVAQREWMDEDGVVHAGEEVLSGEAMAGGPVLLSWRDVRDAGQTADAGYNVVVHEFAHVLDMSDGLEADGRPPLSDPELRARWDEVMSAAYQRHLQAVDIGPGPWLDPYGAQGAEEFFAVTVEAFFVAPDRLLASEPAVYALLSRFFRQDPAVYRR